LGPHRFGGDVLTVVVGFVVCWCRVARACGDPSADDHLHILIVSVVGSITGLRH
jgi:hypothetical protein